MSVSKRFLFRMTYFKNLKTFLDDGAEFAKDSPQGKPRFRISFDEIVARRGTVFTVPSGATVNEFVPFYFSPSTKMAFSIHKGNVPLRSPDSEELGPASMDDVAFMVVEPSALFQSGRECWFTDQACNSGITPVYDNDPTNLAQHVAWPLFDEDPKMAKLPEIGYDGVCRYQHDRDSPPYQQRSKLRMAEFMVKDHLRMDEVSCIVLKSDRHLAKVDAWVRGAALSVPVLVKPGCYF
jgi:hypothetical protein